MFYHFFLLDVGLSRRPSFDAAEAGEFHWSTRLVAEGDSKRRIDLLFLPTFFAHRTHLLEYFIRKRDCRDNSLDY